MSLFMLDMLVLAAYFLSLGYCYKFKRKCLSGAFIALSYAFAMTMTAFAHGVIPNLFWGEHAVLMFWLVLLSSSFSYFMLEHANNADAAVLIGIFSLLYLVIGGNSLYGFITINYELLSVIITAINILIMLAVVHNGDTYRGFCRGVAFIGKSILLRSKARGQ